MERQDFLFELGTEELPAKGLNKFAANLAELILAGLQKAQLQYASYQVFATPRRLAVLIKDLQSLQPHRAIERKGPALHAAFDAQGNPTKACEGFARSCGVAVAALERQETTQGTWLIYRYEEPGKTAQELLPDIIMQALNNLPIPKPMRWGNADFHFLRPVHWLVMLYGSEVIPATMFGIKASNQTFGHRFLCQRALTIATANVYEKLLEDEAHVIPDFAKRRQLVQEQTIAKAATKQGKALITKDLLDEVTGLVEWPVALLAEFSSSFLEVPKEALISAMQHHQKCFALVDQHAKLLPYFITISNIESHDSQQVIVGNERVMRARLTDAAFFYHTDQKIPLADRLEHLKTMVFQAKLGSLYEKSLRVAALAKYLESKRPETLGPLYPDWAETAGKLCKTDLLTAMVGEFPELQGLMAYYYYRATHEEIATAIRDHYCPRFAKDKLPSTGLGLALALADRIDSLVGIFGINQAPTGEKDPFGLRRAAIGVLRLIIENEFALDFAEALTLAKQNYHVTLASTDTVEHVYQFILERLRAWYQEQHIEPDTLAAVLAIRNTTKILLDVHRRVQALQNFRQLPEAATLVALYKRINNILTKENFVEQPQVTIALEHIDLKLLTQAAETDLYKAVTELMRHNTSSAQLKLTQEYTELLMHLVTLKAPIENFFDHVMVNDKDPKLKNNRLALLAALRAFFLQVADISLLQL